MMRMMHVVLTLAFCVTSGLAAVTRTRKISPWERAELKVEPGRYPRRYCSLTNVLLNGTDGAFYYRSERDLLSEECGTARGIWDIRHKASLEDAECWHVYDVGYAYPMFYWHTGSNYFHLHYDLMLPLFKEVYYGKNSRQDSQEKAAFLPTVESYQTGKLDWTTDAFDDKSKYWMQMTEFIAGGHKNIPLNLDILTERNLCFKEVKFGTPKVNYSDKEFVRSFTDFVKSNLEIERVQPEHEKLAIISRKYRRRILNQLELKARANKHVETELIVLEDMTFKEQVQAVQNYTVFAGMNGAGLANCLYLPPKSACVQLVPFEAQVAHDQYAEMLFSHGPYYLEWHNKKQQLDVPVPGDSARNYPDTVVDVDEFIELIQSAIDMKNWKHEEL